MYAAITPVVLALQAAALAALAAGIGAAKVTSASTSVVLAALIPRRWLRRRLFTRRNVTAAMPTRLRLLAQGAGTLVVSL